MTSSDFPAAPPGKHVSIARGMPGRSALDRSIVVGTDFTPCSAVAFAQAMRIAAGSGARLRAVHVVDTRVVTDFEAALTDFQRTVRESLGDAAAAAWRNFAAAIPGAAAVPIDFPVTNRIEGVLEQVRAAQADLLVLGAFGDRRPDVGFGTLATACVRRSTSDVLLVRDTQKGAFRTIVAGTDFSETSLRALDRAARLAVQEGAEMHALHLFDAPWLQMDYLVPDPAATAGMQAAIRGNHERRLDEVARALSTDHPGLRLRAVCDDSGTHRLGIADYAKKVGADLIVVGTRGRTGLRDLLLGSTAERVLAESRCSVLAVRPA